MKLYQDLEEHKKTAPAGEVASAGKEKTDDEVMHTCPHHYSTNQAGLDAMDSIIISRNEYRKLIQSKTRLDMIRGYISMINHDMWLKMETSLLRGEEDLT